VVGDIAPFALLFGLYGFGGRLVFPPVVVLVTALNFDPKTRTNERLGKEMSLTTVTT
jgi:hypothetical protein